MNITSVLGWLPSSEIVTLLRQLFFLKNFFFSNLAITSATFFDALSTPNTKNGEAFPLACVSQKETMSLMACSVFTNLEAASQSLTIESKVSSSCFSEYPCALRSKTCLRTVAKKGVVGRFAILSSLLPLGCRQMSRKNLMMRFGTKWRASGTQLKDGGVSHKNHR